MMMMMMMSTDETNDRDESEDNWNDDAHSCLKRIVRLVDVRRRLDVEVVADLRRCRHYQVIHDPDDCR